MGWLQRLRQFDDRVNRRIGVAGTDTARAVVSERWWWVGPVYYAVLMAFVLVFPLLSESVPTTVLFPALCPAAFLLFQSGFTYNERLRSLGEQSCWPSMRWRRHSHDTPVERVENSSDGL